MMTNETGLRPQASGCRVLGFRVQGGITTPAFHAKMTPDYSRLVRAQFPVRVVVRPSNIDYTYLDHKIKTAGHKTHWFHDPVHH